MEKIKLANKNSNSNHNGAVDVLKSRQRFGKSDDKAIDDVTEMTQLRPRVGGNTSYMSERTPPPDDVVYLEREILPTDTLHSFALLYGCTMNDIKRANNLINEQDFYGLRTIKIPVKRHGLLTEPEEESKRRPVTTSIRGSPNNDVYVGDEMDSADSAENISLLSNSVSRVDKNDANKFLKKVDKEIRKTVRSSDVLERNEILEEVVSSLGSVGYRPLPLPGAKDDCSGADWGVKWWVLLLGFLVVFFILAIGGYEYYHMASIEISNSTPNR